MLSYALAIAVATSSLVLFSTAFLMSKIHRQDDFLWSAVGLFYALVLWYCARNITGAVLLGQAAATVLIVSSNWQTIKLRRAIADPAKAAETNNFSVVQGINGLLKRRQPQVQPSATPVTKAPTPKVTEQNIAIPETPADISEESSKKVVDTDVPITDRDNALDNTVVKAVEKTTSATKDAPNAQVSPAKTEPLPLPNKLPESQPAENESAEKVTIKDTSHRQSTENIQPEVQTEDLFKIVSEVKDTATAKEVEPTPEIAPPEIAKSTQPKSALDSLETVEVAEILEAERDRQSNNRDTDRFNIIEVTTTEINVTTDVTKTDQNQDSSSDDSDDEDT